MNSVDDLSGWGGTFGGTAFFGNIGVGVELNMPTEFFTNGGHFSDYGGSLALPFLNVGAHAGIFGEANYTWLTKTSDWKNVISTLVSDFGFSRAEAKEFASLAQQAYEETKAKADDFEKKFGSGDVQNLEDGTYTWNGKEWVREEEND